MKVVQRLAPLAGWSRLIAALAVSSTALFAVLVAAPAASAKSLVSIKIAEPANPPPGVKPIPSGFVGYAIHLNQEQKILKKYGFTYGGLLTFENTTEADAAVESGSAQIVSQGQAPAILAQANQGGLSVINAGTEPDSTWVMVGPKSTITNIKQLKGQTVGAGFGTNFEQGFLWGLQNAGISAKGVKLANIVVNEGAAALQNSEDGIVAFAASTQLGELWEKEFGDKVIWKSQSYPKDVAVALSMVKSSFAKTHPKIEAAFYALYVDGQKEYQKDPSKYWKWVGLEDDLTAAQAKAAAPPVIESTAIAPAAVTVLNTGLKFFVSLGQAEKKFNIASWLIAPAGTIKK